MSKLSKLFKNLKKLKKENSFLSYLPRTSFLSTPIKFQKNPSHHFRHFLKAHIGNLEFAVFFSLVNLGLYYIYKNNTRLNETVRLIGAGIATHIIVDFVTYLGDKINTKVKVEKFYKKKINAQNEITNFFNKKVIKYTTNKIVKREKSLSKKSVLGNILGDFHFRGIQAAMVFVILNSVIFYGFYKNTKNFLKDKLNITGFSNFFLSAAFAQFLAMIVAFPLENIKTRMQASNFHYDSFFKYYNKLIKGKSAGVVLLNFKNEYSGFVSHLVLYVIYESVTFAIYESLIKYFENGEQTDHVALWKILVASSVSGVVSAVVTNPIDVYQINKQVNPKFSLNQLDFNNIMTGMKERIYFITFLNLCTFIVLESISQKYFNVRLE